MGMEIIGHRGAAFDALENTLASFRLAWEQGADAIECDVWLTEDGQIVAIHDPDTGRVAGLAKPVVEQSLDELRRLDIGRWRGEKFVGEKTPTLAEVLSTVPAGKRIFIEVKCGSEIVPELQRVLAKSGLASQQTVVISFSSDVVRAAKAELPAFATFWCVDLAKFNAADRFIRPAPCTALIAAAKAIGADGLDLSASPAITRDLVEPARAAGLPVYVWTVNDPAFAKQLIAAGVAGITTDRPGWLRDQLKM
jgi:glycerophosphoryl diester phosphodiesterase